MGAISAKFESRPRSWGGSKPRETVLIHGTKVSTLAESVAITHAKPLERIEKFNRLRARDTEFAAWLFQHDPETSLSVGGCGARLVMRHYETVGETRIKAVLPEFCRKRFLCSMCDAIRAGKTLGRYVDRVLTVLREEKWRCKCYLVTFTVKDGEDLAERVRKLRESYRLVMKRRRRHLSISFRGKFTEAVKAIGGMQSVEVKRGSGSGMWHPHMHCVWICDEAPDESRLRDEWHEITGDSWVVDVRPFHSMESADGLNVATRDALGKDLCEVVKYSLKFSDMSFSDQWYASQVLRKAVRAMRLFGSFGRLWGLKEEKLEVDTLISELDADLKFVDMLWDWSAEARQYALTNIARGGVHVLTGEEVFAK